jgi:hypothetical protein
VRVLVSSAGQDAEHRQNNGQHQTQTRYRNGYGKASLRHANVVAVTLKLTKDREFQQITIN